MKLLKSWPVETACGFGKFVFHAHAMALMRFLDAHPVTNGVMDKVTLGGGVSLHCVPERLYSAERTRCNFRYKGDYPL
jgi:hypothetical protein